MGMVGSGDHDSIDILPYFIEHTPGAFYNLGCGADPASAFPLHSPNFSPDERCMRYGLMMHLALANEHLHMDD